MSTQPRLLVVDDEQVVCESCTRIFEHQGFVVDTCTDPMDGLQAAQQGDYSAILLDIKMPNMDGVEFLEKLRRTRQDVPVVMITGYASVSSAAQAMRLGAADYVPKPFIPAEIVEAVSRLLSVSEATSDVAPRQAGKAREPKAWTPSAETLFVGDSWMQLGSEGTVRAGVFASRVEALETESVGLPEVGERIQRDLPMVSFRMKDGSIRLYPAPLSGTVVCLNNSAVSGKRTWEDPCGAGWLLLVRPSQLPEDMAHARPRRLVLLNPNLAELQIQDSAFRRLGCCVYPVLSGEDALEALHDFGCSLLILDASQLGCWGPEVVSRVNDVMAEVKVVVLGGDDPKWEAAYRARRILYYAVNPFNDGEILDILATALSGSGATLPGEVRQIGPPCWIHCIRMTNRTGTLVSLLAGESLLMREQGLGFELTRLIQEGRYPLEVEFGSKPVTETGIMAEMGRCQRLLVLGAAAPEAVPGSIRMKRRLWEVPKGQEMGPAVTVLEVGPTPIGDYPLLFDTVTSRTLAADILGKMTQA